MHEIYQIFYNESTQKSNDPGFLPLDNLSNERPDWSEYWPIRRFFTGRTLSPDTYYGFLSPKFHQKTGLSAQDVRTFLVDCTDDVVLFSPFFDQSAFAINIFEQGNISHRNIDPILSAAFMELNSNIRLSSLVTHSKNTVFCNYFVAKPVFWKVWLECCEKIFQICEQGDSALSHQLNILVEHDTGMSPAKGFVIERVASFMLALGMGWRVQAYNPMRLPMTTSPVARFKDELCRLDALKIAFCESGYPDYIKLFKNIRMEILDLIEASDAR